MKKVSSQSPLHQGMMAVMILGIAGCILFALLHGILHADWLLSTAIAFGTTAYHILIRFLSPVLIYGIFRRRYNPDHPWFRPRCWETRLYRLLKVKSWKAHAPAYDPSQFSFKRHSMKQILQYMCHAELIHELNILLSFTSLFFAISFGALPVFLITALLAALFDGIFVIIQRYNRPRIAALAKRSHNSL